jgi:YD repeat-containing protein
MRAVSRLIGVLLIAGVAAAVMADQHPNIARGFDIGKPYSMNGLDNINLFNGNLTVTLPVGQRYYVNGNLGYGLTLVYSGNVWDNVGLEQITCNGTVQWANRTYPNRRSNAGLGWLLSLGRLFPNNVYPTEESAFWQYETPDGALHALTQMFHGVATSDPNLYYTNDGTYLRMKVNSGTRTIEFPDGTSQVFKELSRPSGAGAWTISMGTGVWRLVEIKDRFANSVAITYSTEAASGSNPDYPEVWTINDGVRTQSVYFKASPSSAWDIVLDRVMLPTFNGTTGEWKVGYMTRTVTLGYSDHGCSGIVTTVPNIPLLTSLTLPPVNNVSQVYSMVKPDDPTSPNYYVSETTFRPLNGHLRGMQLPTRGWLEWDYAVHVFFEGTENRISRSVAVTARRMVEADRTPNHTYTWTYQRAKSANPSCVDPVTQIRNYDPPEQMVVSVTSPPPESVTVVHYFSVYQSTITGCYLPTVFQSSEYSLPFSRGISDPRNASRFLSSETFSTPPTALIGPNYRATGGTRVRSEWIYMDRDDPNADAVESNQRESLHATDFEGPDASACSGSTCFNGTTNYDFDGGGHFRTSVTSSNLPGSTFKTRFTKFVSVGAADPDWLLSRFTEKCIAEESAERTSAPSDCSGLAGGNVVSGPFVQAFCFDNDGFLKRRRTYAGATKQNRDVITVFTQSAGNVVSEKYYGGGDDAGADLSSGTLCDATLPSSDYEIFHEYQYGSLLRSYYGPSQRTGRTANPSFKLVDNTIDSKTGLVSASKDAAGLQTTFDYDVLGRVKQMAPPGEAAVNYTFTEATSSNPASATVKRISSSQNTGNTTAERTVQATTIFDDFGRAVQEQRLMPTDTAVRKTELTPSGWTTKVYEWDATPAKYTLFSDFDVFGRARSITAPDGSTTTITYDGVKKVTRSVNVQTPSGAVAAITTENYDRFGRLVELDEPGGSKASYAYDAADRLNTVTMGVQTRQFDYDGRGFLAHEKHPENDDTYYEGYDTRGHPGKKLVGSSNSAFDLFYDYDAAERLLSVKHPATRTDQNPTVLKSFDFATANDANNTNFRQGKLEVATRYNYTPIGLITVKETYAYVDPAGRLSNKTTEILNPSSILIQKFAQPYAYNDLGLPSSVTYPTCADSSRPCGTASAISSYSPTYKNGLLMTVPQFANGITYDLNGMTTQIDHPGSISDVISIDSSNRMARPSRIQFNSFDACTAPAIAQQPLTQQVVPGAFADLSIVIEAGATQTVSYQWFRDGSEVPISGATSATYRTPPLTETATFTARAFNSCGKADSNPAVITVCGAPSISTQPQSVSIAPGGTTRLSVQAAGCDPISFQWYAGSASNTSNPVGTNSRFFDTPALNANTNYWVRVIDGASGTRDSNTATVTVCNAPVITTQPLSQTINSGSSATLTVGASGCGPFVYQWYAGAAPSTSTPVGSGASSYTTPALTESSAYWVRVTDTAGTSANSTTATITVNGNAAPPTPGPLTATYNPATGKIDLVWGASPGVLYYEIERTVLGGHTQAYPDPLTQTSYSDGVTYENGGAHVYRVRACAGINACSAFSTRDIATRMTFADVHAPNGSGAVVIQFSHLEELRQAMNAVRSVAGDGPLSWEQILAPYVPPDSLPPPAPGHRVRAVFMIALRAKMNEALSNALMPTAPYTDDFQVPTRIKAIHTLELQQRAR